MNTQTFYFDLTAHEQAELRALSALLFDGAKFKVFSKQEKATAAYKRYDVLVKRKLRYLAQVNSSLITVNK